MNVPDGKATVRNAGTLVDADLTARHRAFLAATSDNTRRTYRSAIRHFLTWGGTLPGDEATMIRYLLAYAPSLNPRTLALRLTALSQWHVHQGFADPASTPTVRKTLAGIARILVRRRHARAACQIEKAGRAGRGCKCRTGCHNAKTQHALMRRFASYGR
jgi:hypothetical protein